VPLVVPIASSIGTLVGTLLLHPFDTIKTRILLSNEKNSIFKICNKIIKNEGFFSL